MTNANLASIPDIKTNDFVNSKVSWRSWIGLELKRQGREEPGEWMWTDGSAGTWRNWIPRQPSGDGSFVEIVKNPWTGESGQWNDLGLEWSGQTNLRGSVCQYDPKGNLGHMIFSLIDHYYQDVILGGHTLGILENVTRLLNQG